MKFFVSILCVSLSGIYAHTAQADTSNLSAAVTDVAGKKICDRLQNRFRGLQQKNQNEEKVYSGTLWIHSCQVSYDDSQQNSMTLSLGINGWRWLDRKKEVLGADFSTDEFARFKVDVDLTGKVITHYAPQTKRLALWFKPQQPPKVNFKAAGDVDIDKDSMWGSALAGAATLIGQSPDTIADEKLAKKGEQRFMEKIAEGFSAAIDFCSGKVISELGQPDRKTLLGKLDKEQSSGFKNVDLAPSTFLLFGPYGEQSPSLNLVLRQDNSDEFKSKLLCVDDAVKLAEAYMTGSDRTPDVPSIDIVRENAENGDISLTGKHQTCPVVAMFATDKSVKKHAAFKFRVQDNDEPKPLAVCK